MPSATSAVQVGVRELRNNLSRYLDLVRDGQEVVVTDRGRPIARLMTMDPRSDRLNDLIEAGLVRPAAATARRRSRPVTTGGTVSDLVSDQRR